MTLIKVLLLSAIIASTAIFFFFDGQHYLSLEALKSQQAVIDSYRNAQPGWAVVLYAFLYIIVTGLSLPGATVLTLAGGALFGLGWGALIVSFASTIGATLAFLAARFLLRNSLQARFGKHIKIVNEGIKRNGAWYLLTLRLVPAFPFFIINLAMGLTTLKTWTFYWVSQLGMLAGTVVYVNAGTQLAKIEALSDIMSPDLWVAFGLLGLFPLGSQKIVALLQTAHVHKKWLKPKRFDNNLIIIGAGSGGLVTAYIAAAVKAKVTLIERHKMGGDCLNTGCVPSKALIRSAKWLSQLRRAQEFGIRQASADFDFADIMARVQKVIKTVEPHDSIERYTELGVDVLLGEAKIISPWAVQITTESTVTTLTTRAIVIAAGARPFMPAIPGIEQVAPLTSDTVWHLPSLPKRLLVLGGGPVGCELAQSFARLGSQVIQVEMAPRLLMREDADASAVVMARFKAEGIDVRVNHTAHSFMIENGKKILLADCQGQPVTIPFDQVLVALGRKANIKDYGIAALDIALTPHQTVATNAFQATNYPNIYAVGDVTGPYQLTHVAGHQARYAAVNALFSPFARFRTDLSVIPWSTFTDPEVARVGLNEQEAQAQNLAYNVIVYDISELDRAIADGEAHGFVKILTRPGKDKILGVTLVGEHAGDLLAEFVLAMKHGIGLNKLLGTIHIYPTLAEANKYAAGVWKRRHTPPSTLRWLARYHAWRRR